MLRLLQQHVHSSFYDVKHMPAVWHDTQVGQSCSRLADRLCLAQATQPLILLEIVINGLNTACGTLKCMIASVEGQIRDLTWREAAGAGVDDLEHVYPC
jgi:hypothetical protein